MAIRHGRAGQYGKTQATKRFRHVFAVTLCLVGVLGLVAGIGIGNAWGMQSALLTAAVAVLAVGIYFAVRRWIEPHLDEIAKERIRHLRGGQAEGFVAYLLEQGLSDDWHVFNGVKLERDSDIDHVVVGPGGVFCISTKSQRGLFVATRDEPGLLYNNEPCAFAKQALGQAMGFKDRFAVVMGGNVPWVHAVLAVPFGFTDGGDACGGKVWLVHQEDMTDRLAPEEAAAKLNKSEVERAVNAIEMIQQRAASVYQRPASEPAASTNSGV